MVQLNVQKEGYAEDIGGCRGDVFAVLKYVKDFGGSFRVVGGGIVIILLPIKQFLGSCLASSDLCLPGTMTDRRDHPR